MPGGSSNTTTEPTRTWASGRKLSDAERARKREVDRRTKAANRQRERQRVADLEAKLSDLTQRHIAQQSHVSELVQAIEELKRENSRYRHDLISLRNQKTTNESQDATGSGLLDVDSTVAPTVSGTRIVEAHETISAPGSNSTLLPNSINDKSSCGDDLPSPSFANAAEPTTINPTDLSIPAAPPPLADDSDPDNTTSSVISQRLISSARKVNSIAWSSICLDDIENQDSLIRIALTGNVGKAANCPAWERMVETFDQCIQYCGTVERFVMLRMIHQMILFQIARRSGQKLILPDWYKPRPVQMRVPHEEIADYFAWPAFRERLVFSLSAISQDDFWIAFATNFQFCAPSVTLENVLNVGPDGKYTFMPSFESDMRNFKNWRMRLEFFEQFPELYDFMVPLDSLPKQMSNKDLGQWQWQWPVDDTTSLVKRKPRRGGGSPKTKSEEPSTQPAPVDSTDQMQYSLTSGSS